jgi:hypothetical protein
MTEIEITIAADGTVTTRVKGGCGKSCADFTKPIRDALGETTEDRRLPEYYANVEAGARVKGGAS